MFKMIIYGFLIYLLYKFIFELVVPVSKATTQMKEKIEEMQRRQASQQPPQQAPPEQTMKATGKDNDYIDYEEVKP